MSGCLTTSRTSSQSSGRASSPVGKRFQSCAIRPPRNGRFSISVTFMPRSARSRAAVRPATPPPITSAAGWIGMRRLLSGTRWRARFTAARTRRDAFAVAASRSSMTQDTCSRMLTCSKRYWLRPARSTVRRNVTWCSVGEQAATTTRLSACSRIFCSMSACPGSEQLNMCVVAKTTSGHPRRVLGHAGDVHHVGDVAAAVADEHADARRRHLRRRHVRHRDQPRRTWSNLGGRAVREVAMEASAADRWYRKNGDEATRQPEPHA